MLFYVLLKSNNWVGVRKRLAEKAATAELQWKHVFWCSPQPRSAQASLLVRGESHPLQLLFNSVQRGNANRTGKSPLQIKACCDAKNVFVIL